MKCCDDCSCHLCRELAAGFIGKCKLNHTNKHNVLIQESNFILCERTNDKYKSVILVPGPPSDTGETTSLRPGGAGGSSRELMTLDVQTQPATPNRQISGSSHCIQQPTIAITGTKENSAMPQTRTTPPKPPIPSPEAAQEVEREEPPPPTKTLAVTTPQRKAMVSSTRQLSTSTNSNSGRKNVLGTLPHHHLSVDELRLMQLQRRHDSNGSSSDDNRSSGHASMSDGHTSSSPPIDRHHHYKSHLNSVPEDERLSASVMPTQSRPGRKNVQSRSRHRATPAKLVPCGSGIEDIKLAIQQLTMRSHTSNTGYSTSTYSSLSGSESSEPAVRRLMRHSSLETINTNVTSADEFVWVDSHNRLVELQHLPWSNHDVLKVIQNGRVKENMERVAMETIPRLSYLLQRALVRLAREAQRLSKSIAMCGKQQVASSLRIILCPVLSDSCIKACLRSAAMFAVSGDQLKQSKSSRAGLQLSVGRFHRWMVDVRLGKFVHEYAAVYLAAGLENLLEEIILQCLPSKADTVLTASMFEHSIANNGDLWGLLQPYAHLNTGRTASGTLALPRWASISSVSTDSTVQSSHGSTVKHSDQSLLTTCVGSVAELAELINRTSCLPFNNRSMTWCHQAIQALFYFMRCSQLEHSGPVQELVYERAYIVLPPLVEWIRTTTAHAEYRHSTVIDQDDVMQAARLLLPGVDCPIRQLGCDEGPCSRRPGEELESVRRLKTAIAFRMLSSGSREIVAHALQLLPITKLNTVCDSGLTPLMLSVLSNDEANVRCLLEFGCDPDIETPPQGTQGCPTVQAEYQYWTALTYAALVGNTSIAKLLLDRGANVEGGARLSEEKCTITPLQVAAGSGNIEMVSLLLSHGAHPFFSTLLKDSLCYSGAAQRGCYSAIAVAASHGQRTVLHKLLSHPLNPNTKEVLSLEEILAEGANQLTADRKAGSRLQGAADNSAQLLKLSKSQMKCLQEAMYHSTENNHLEITLDIRNLGVAWTLHCWMYTLQTAHDHHLENMIDQLLQDFLQVWPDDCSSQFVDECLPLLFNIFRYSKNEGTTLLLADIFSTCFGWEPIKRIRDSTLSGGARIDPKFVNNAELSDVQFRVEGRVFYGHKIVLVTSSPRFRGMLSSKLCEGNPPIVQINDIRYHIFQLVMQFLYNGGCDTLEVDHNDVLELMAAANFFQLDGLLRFCEAQCSDMVDVDNIVSMYIHAKVYNACQLMEYCQGFLLQNMVALLTYDDSVKRLLFGKKLHNHDVLAGLLLTLQARIKARNNSVRPAPKPK
uniref:BTB domain-containing protein n=4 Tax=Clastoptera arizonana TaxID=38151 RepID=A0A1B6DL13_9HEMI